MNRDAGTGWIGYLRHGRLREHPAIGDDGAQAAHPGRPAATGASPVQKTRIVRLEWERWDQAGDDPGEYPDGGEPEDYILCRPHDPELAAQIGPLWEVVLPASESKPKPTWCGTSW